MKNKIDIIPECTLRIICFVTDEIVALENVLTREFYYLEAPKQITFAGLLTMFPVMCVIRQVCDKYVNGQAIYGGIYGVFTF